LQANRFEIRAIDQQPRKPQPDGTREIDEVLVAFAESLPDVTPRAPKHPYAGLGSHITWRFAPGNKSQPCGLARAVVHLNQRPGTL
jgi:hypothetical protein